MAILENIKGHGDLISLNDSQRIQLCGEIRQFLVESISRTGGHLASNLGVVELSVALETVFDTEKDRLVFDVGHQSYVHKLLTGRQADFQHLRQLGGIAGFPKPSESPTDPFVAGHASSSVSIALGMARARTLRKEDYRVVAVLGDGAASGGMAYEGFNDVGVSREPMLIILNDNEMSIDRNVGAMARHLSRLRTKERYLGMKERYRRFLAGIPGGKAIYNVTHRVKNALKRVLLPGTVFDDMGLTYLGPVDGHDLPSLIRLLRQCKQMKEPVLLHVITQKGKGYPPAERNPAKFHGVGRFDPRTGQTLSADGNTFSQTFGDTLVELAQERDELCAITAAMPGGTGLLKFKGRYPRRLFDVGIAEEHAVSMAGGLAKQGMVPVVALYSTFLQRSYDQILQDIAMLGLHVVLAVDRAGLVGEDGETHHGVFDVGFLRQAPGLTLLAPASCSELKRMLRWAVCECTGPVAIRYPRGGDGRYDGVDWQPGRGVAVHGTGADCALLTYGTLVNNAVAAADALAAQGIGVTVLRLTQLNPLPLEELEALLPDGSRCLVLEEVAAGCGVAGELALKLPKVSWNAADLGGEFIKHGSNRELYQLCGLDGAAIEKRVKEVLSVEN